MDFNSIEAKQIMIKAALAIAVLLALGVIYDQLQIEHDLARFAPQAELVTQASEADIIYLGDCSDVYCAPEDSNSIAAVLQRELGQKQVIQLSSNGYHGRVFAQLLEAVADSPLSTPKTVVVTLNLRSFAPHITHDFYYSPGIYQQLILLDPQWPSFINRLRLSFNSERSIDKERLKSKVEQDENRTLSTVNLGGNQPSLASWKSEYNSDAVAHSYLNDFAFEISSDHPRIRDFDAICTLAEHHDWNLLFHLVPVNYQMADSLIGRELATLIDRNNNFLKERYSNMGVTFIDNTRSIEMQGFMNVKSNSHLHSTSKELVAQKVLDALEKN